MTRKEFYDAVRDAPEMVSAIFAIEAEADRQRRLQLARSLAIAFFDAPVSAEAVLSFLENRTPEENAIVADRPRPVIA